MNRDPAYLLIYKDIQKEILNGIYAYGMKLPSKRDCAQMYGVSEITAAHAYALLEEEGYVISKQRSGTYVNCHPDDVLDTVNEETEKTVRKKENDSESFPYTVFAKASRKVLSDYQEEVLRQSEGQGSMVLRHAIVLYLARNRDIHVKENQIVIGAGSEYLYSLVVALTGRSVIYGIEDPCFEKIRNIYRSEGVRMDPLKLGDNGILSEELERTPASVLHVTPYHSWPSGKSTDAQKRREYVEWAEKRNAWIIEDDYESEFTPSLKSEETLFSLDPERVIYMNTFTKTVSPSIRLGYMILPADMRKRYEETQSFRSCTVSEYVQLIMAELLNDGSFERQINRIRRKRRER